ncbi:hypothetical protein BsWGS_21723 [Bradybaena similaris]
MRTVAIFSLVFVILGVSSAYPSLLQKFLDCEDFGEHCDGVHPERHNDGLCALTRWMITCAKSCQMCTPTS